VIIPMDDYPIHQTTLPLAHPASGDPNHYDRFFFNGFDPEGGWCFGATLAVYPNRGIIDAAFSIVRDGEQRSVYASGRAPADRARTAVGPIAIDILEPLGRNTLRVTAREQGIEAELTWQPRTAALEEPRQMLVQGSTTVMDATRLVQWGRWNGTIVVDGSRIDVTGAPGTKDRSWGIRPIGDPVPGAPATGGGGGVFFLWAPVHFEDRCIHVILFEHPDGRRWYETAATVPLDGPPLHATRTEYELEIEPGTRRARSATLTLTYPDGSHDRLLFEPMLRFQTKGLGYLHPTRGHGRWHGEEAVASESWMLDGLDPLDLSNVHVQQICRVRRGDQIGIGTLEQLIIGPHAPTGFTDLLDGAR